MDLKKLAEPFPADDIEWRVQRAGEKNGNIWAMVLAYVTNRAIMSRLDSVCGPENWQNDYKVGPSGGNLCGISIWIDEARGWVTKWDGADNTNIEGTKGGLSDSMKRAAVQWGPGRYLYKLEATFALVHADGKLSAKAKVDGSDKWFKWDPPQLPAWALPKTSTKAPKQAPAATKDKDVAPAQVNSEKTEAEIEKALAVREMTEAKTKNPDLFDIVAENVGIKGKAPKELSLDQCQNFLDKFIERSD